MFMCMCVHMEVCNRLRNWSPVLCWFIYKKLCYHRGTERCTVSRNLVSCTKNHIWKACNGELRWLKVIGIASQNRCKIGTSYLKSSTCPNVLSMS